MRSRPIQLNTNPNAFNRVPRIVNNQRLQMIKSCFLRHPLQVVNVMPTHHTSPIKISNRTENKTEPSTPLQLHKTNPENNEKLTKKAKGIFCVICNQQYQDGQLQKHLNKHKNSLAPSQVSPLQLAYSRNLKPQNKTSISHRKHKQFDPIQCYEQKVKKISVSTVLNQKRCEESRKQKHNTQNKPQIHRVTTLIPTQQQITPPVFNNVFKPMNLGFQNIKQQKDEQCKQYSIYDLLDDFQQNQQELQITKNKASKQSNKTANYYVSKNKDSNPQTKNLVKKQKTSVPLMNTSSKFGKKYPFIACQSRINHNHESFNSMSLKVLF